MGNAGSRPPIPGILDQWQSQTKKLRIIHVGAGAAGLCFMYKVKTQLIDYEIVTYEKNSDIGGTWLERPAIPGIESFKGTLMHSAHWDPTANCTDKTVAVLGTGSSAIQIVPHVQKVASKVKCFMRSSTWIAPALPRIPVKLDEQPSASVDTVTDDQRLPEDEGQYYYTEQEMKKLEQDPAFLLEYRKRIEFKFDQVFALFYKDSVASQQAVEHMIEVMKRRLKNHPELCQRLIPSWPVGCRRLTPGPDYLEALIASNVEALYADITSIDASGLKTADDGQHHAVGVFICATGFDLAWTPHYPIVGRNGKSLQEAWAPWPNCYLGVAAPGFPNYWQMNGPRGNLGNGPVLSAVETQAEFVIKAIKKMQAHRIKILEVRQDITERLNQRIDMWMQGAVWSADCKSD
ncbi:battenin CLN3 protein [Pestalotiopsis sp. IQ-011]